MSIPPEVRAVLPEETAAAWRTLAPLLPAGACLAGGTAIATRLQHRISRDLDFFVAKPFDVPALEARLRQVGRFGATTVGDGTLNGVLDGAKVQFLLAQDQVQLRPTTPIGGIEVASLEDLQAMKLRAVGGRGELRDYFDLMELERLGGLDVARGLGFYLARYHPADRRAAVEHVVRALGYLDDVADDPGLPVARGEIERYWRRHQPAIVEAARLGFLGSTAPPDG